MLCLVLAVIANRILRDDLFGHFARRQGVVRWAKHTCSTSALGNGLLSFQGPAAILTIHPPAQEKL